MLTRLALRYRIVTIVLMLVLMVGGVFSLTRLQIELFPDIEFPAVTVSAFYQDASPQEVLVDVVLPLEQALDGMGQITTLQTVSAPNIAQVFVVADFGEDMEAMEAEIRERLSGLSFPAGVEPRIARIGFDEFPVVEVAVASDDSVATLAATIRAEVLPELQAIPGVVDADVPLGIEDGTSITRANGRPSVNTSVLKEADANTVEVANAVTDKLDELAPTLDGGVEVIEIYNQGPQIQASIDELQQHVLLGAVFAVLVIFAFLLSVRPTLVASVAIPVSVLAAFIVMDIQGMTLNILTLGGLAIAVGRVVDDSIVVMENTFRHIQRGETPRAAALKAAREVAVPITASTLTTIAVFAPLALIGGFISIIFLPFALTITYALLASLVVALTIVPVLAALFIPRAHELKETWIERWYTRTIRYALGHRWRTVSLGVLLTVASFFVLPFIPVSFLPGGGESALAVQMTVPGASGRDAVLAQLDEVESVLEGMRETGDIEAYSSAYGATNLFAGQLGSANEADLQVRLAEGADAQETADVLRETLDGEGREVRVSTVSDGGPDSSALELILQGDDYPTLVNAAENLTERIAGIDGLVNVSHNGIDVGGAPELSADLPIVRVDGRQSVTISGSIVAQNTQAINLEIQEIVEENPLPEGVELVTGGVFQDIDEAFSQMGIAMLLSVILVYVVMVVTQRSFVIPFIIVLSLPLAFIGAFGALFVTQRALGLPALMGLLMLIGLVVTNAIVLIAFVEQLRAQGMGLFEALVEGGRTRLRPILMTALTTTFVLLPMALGLGAESGGIIGAELATVVIGGLLASTFLTLVVIPVVYSFLRKKGPKVKGPEAEREPAPVGA